MPHQIAVTVHAPLRPGRGPEVAASLDTQRKDVEHDGGRGGAYFFLPGVAALRYLADLPAEQPDAAPDEESR